MTRRRKEESLVADLGGLHLGELLPTDSCRRLDADPTLDRLAAGHLRRRLRSVHEVVSHRQQRLLALPSSAFAAIIRFITFFASLLRRPADRRRLIRFRGPRAPLDGSPTRKGHVGARDACIVRPRLPVKAVRIRKCDAGSRVPRWPSPSACRGTSIDAHAARHRELAPRACRSRRKRASCIRRNRFFDT